MMKGGVRYICRMAHVTCHKAIAINRRVRPYMLRSPQPNQSTLQEHHIGFVRTAAAVSRSIRRTISYQMMRMIVGSDMTSAEKHSSKFILRVLVS